MEKIYILIENFSDCEDSWYNILFASKDEQFIKNEMTRLQSRETCLYNLEKAIETFKKENCINYNDFIKTLDLKKRKEYTSTSWEDLTTEQKKKRVELTRENIEIERYNAEIKNNNWKTYIRKYKEDENEFIKILLKEEIPEELKIGSNGKESTVDDIIIELKHRDYPQYSYEEVELK